MYYKIGQAGSVWRTKGLTNASVGENASSPPHALAPITQYTSLSQAVSALHPSPLYRTSPGSQDCQDCVLYISDSADARAVGPHIVHIPCRVHCDPNPQVHHPTIRRSKPSRRQQAPKATKHWRKNGEKYTAREGRKKTNQNCYRCDETKGGNKN